MQKAENKQRKVPMRHCMGCAAEKPKSELLRIVRAPDQTVSLDFTGKKSGRGAYLCKCVQCLYKAQKSKRIEHALACEIPPEVYEMMGKELQAYGKS